MKVQYLVDGVEVSQGDYYKATGKKRIKVTSDVTLEHIEELRHLLEMQLKDLEDLEKYEKQKSPEQESPKQEYPKPPEDSFNENEK